MLSSSFKRHDRRKLFLEYLWVPWGSGAAGDTAVLGLTRPLAHPVCRRRNLFSSFSPSSACRGKIEPEHPCTVTRLRSRVLGAAALGTRALGLAPGWGRWGWVQPQLHGKPRHGTVRLQRLPTVSGDLRGDGRWREQFLYKLRMQTWNRCPR